MSFKLRVCSVGGMNLVTKKPCEVSPNNNLFPSDPLDEAKGLMK